jgi:signal transduction histidine kinase
MYQPDTKSGNISPWNIRMGTTKFSSQVFCNIVDLLKAVCCALRGAKTVGYLHMRTHLIRTFTQNINRISKTKVTPLFGSPQQLQILLDSVDATIYVSDLDTYEILFVNQYGKKLFGDIIGKTCWKVLQVGQSEPCPFCTNYQLINPDGTPAGIVVWEFRNTITGKWYQCRDRAIRWTDGKLVRMEIATDVSSGKLYEEQIERMNVLKKELRSLYTDLEDKVAERTTELTRIQQVFQEANTKLNLLNSVTRHDILNQITLLSGYLELSSELAKNEEQIDYIEKAKNASRVIQQHMLFTRLYQDIGVHSPSWQSVRDAVVKAIGDLNPVLIQFQIDLTDIEIYADSLLEKVFYTLIDNTIRHGGHTTIIRFSNQLTSEGMVLIYEDNGSGIDHEDKEKIFECGYGKNTGFGLYLAREVLAITDMTIREEGEMGKGARFEITVPENNHRLSFSE